MDRNPNVVFQLFRISAVWENTFTLCTNLGVETYQLDVMSVIMTAFGIHIPKQDMVAMTWNKKKKKLHYKQ